MCGRYLLTSSPADVARQFGVDVLDDFPPRYNIAPAQPVAVIRISERRQKEYALVRWGFIPSWAGRYDGAVEKRPLAYTKAETLLLKASYKSAFKRQRCLVPANGFYEWRGGAGNRQPFHITRRDGGLFALAGIWETVLAKNGSEAETLALITTTAGEDVSRIHRREPVVIAPGDYEAWLTADERDVEDLLPLLRPSPAGAWKATRVSPMVNDPTQEGARLIEPFGQTELFG